jgi:transposase
MAEHGMKRYVEGANRSQSVLFPEKLDDYIGEDNPVRVIDVFVDELPLKVLGFDGMDPEDTGRPSYHPATLLKIYIYGYLNRIQSSRRLERETQRNVELIWLTGRLSPDFKTIADFRKDNGLAIRKVCSHFVSLCRETKLFSEAVVAIDGSKFKAVNNADRAFTEYKLQMRMAQLEENVGRYLEELDRADREPSLVSERRVTQIQKRIETIRVRMKELSDIGLQMQASSHSQIALTDPDARCMSSRGRDTTVVGYNVQAAVDAKNHLIVTHDVTNVGSDRAQLSPMAEKAREVMGTEQLTALADRGYYSGEQIRRCEDNGITTYVPKSMTSNNRAQGLYDKKDFQYLPETDEYRCPAGEIAIHRCISIDKGLTQHRYWSSACPKCLLKPRCTTGTNRRITRWEHEHIVERVQDRLLQNPEAMAIRRRTVEHTFGTIKAWMGSTHFLTKTLPRVSTEMSLHVLAYNMKRVMKILGQQQMMQMVRA